MIRAAGEGIDTLMVEAGQADCGAQFIECIDNCTAIPGASPWEARPK